jgi:hypothetical protein
MRTKNHILTLLEHGLSFNTISSLNDNQIKVLSEKFSKKEENKEAQDIQTKIRRFSSSEVSNAKTKGESLPGGRSFKLNADGSVDVTLEGEMSEDDTVDFVNDPDATEDGMGMFESEMKEKFESKSQQGLFWAKCKNSTGKTKEKWCKMAKEFSDSTSKKDYKKMPDKKHPEKTVKKTNENLERFLEDRIVNMLDEYVNPTFTKSQMVKTISEKSNKVNSIILKNPKKMSMFSDESGIEMKRMERPIGRISSLGEDTKEKERTKERDKTKEKDRKKGNPFRDPNPDVQENPKANTKEKERTKEKPGTKTPTRRKGNPFKDPSPDVDEKPKAKMEKQQSSFIDAIMNVLNF